MKVEALLSAIAFKEGDAWIIQGIEHDICAHAWDPADVPEAFVRAVVESMCIAEHLGKQGLESIKPAPERFREMFRLARTKVVPVDDETTARLPVRGLDIRFALSEAHA
ncbi:MAG: hypothetical protein IV086_10475 [Hyphomonadaceae bacterium]|nr:MAG: hypothetical protein FD160_2528 [Caulobacteraceae bacterium]MBT9446112.1 hypothetical protein [Hyphomonadaceae bacterium]TPW06020.1 MAG: hypothetical protein FD124_1904 [Alphaproteobacteria bacterium]